MHKENEIFRNYEIEEFIFDDCIKEQIVRRRKKLSNG